MYDECSIIMGEIRVLVGEEVDANETLCVKWHKKYPKKAGGDTWVKGRI